MAKIYNVVATKFNNYYNRILKKYDSLDAYIEGRPSFNQETINFNPNDGIETTFILGKGENSDESIGFHNFDYFIYYYYDTEEEENKIISRWFILDSVRTRGGQVRLRLRRDVLADSYNALLNAPLYIEKGIINNLDSPMLYNNEDLRVNQIKKREILLKDRTDCPWLIIYLKKGVLGNADLGPNHDGKIPINVPSQSQDFVYLKLNTPIASWSYYQYRTADYKVNNFDVFTVNWVYDNIFGSPRYRFAKFKFWDNQPNSSSESVDVSQTNLVTDDQNATSKLNNAYIPQRNALRSLLLSDLNYNGNNALLEFNDKVIKDSQGRYFRVRVYSTGTGSTNHAITSATAPALKTAMSNIWNAAFSQSLSVNDSAFEVKANWENFRITLEELFDVNTSIDLAAYTGRGTTDSPLFDVVCMPYGSLKIYGSGGLIDIDTESARSMVAMSSFANVLTSQYVLDLQILPYCPVQSLINASDSHKISISYFNDTCIGGYEGGELTDVMIVCEQSNFTFDIVQKVEIQDNSDVSSNFKIKYLNDCTMLRICSPNYNGLFEMNLAKNGGVINNFNVDVTLRPYNPYIHVNPDFNFLYGSDFNDVRGLVCNGDFSLGILNDAWNVYEIQNRNYQAIFDRQIQNLDVNNAITMQESLWGMVAGVGSGAVAGAAGGAMVGGGWGALAGGVLGAGASLAGGALDIENLRKRQEETRNYAIDNFNLSLGNVRALPNSITKTSALTYNNKLFPFVEIYECSEEEKQEYYLKLKYSGMTVRKIDVLKNYTSGNNSNYLRAKLIRLENADLIEDYHYFSIINEELMKGVFI